MFNNQKKTFFQYKDPFHKWKVSMDVEGSSWIQQIQ